MAKRVFPQPALPQTRDVRPVGNPPPVISSKPLIPVADFGKGLLSADILFPLFIEDFTAKLTRFGK
jgi:hypothetical protein